MKQLESETDSVPEQQRSSSWRRIRRWLGFVSSTSQREGNDTVSTAEFKRIDPLGGILHPNWEARKAAEAAEADRPFPRRWFSKLVTWLRADEPNLATFDAMLIVDEEERRNPPQLTERQRRERKAASDAFKGLEPDETDFYRDFVSPGSSIDSE
jgi:hypothetical protein